MKKYLSTAALTALLFLLPINAFALTINLDTAFSNYDPNWVSSDPFATVELTQQTDAVDFQVVLNDSILGSNADIQWFYFNTTSDLAGISLSSAVPTGALSYSFNSNSPNPYRAGGGGYYDGYIDFGNGTPYYSTVDFTLSRTGILIDDFLTESMNGRGNGDYVFALHAQTTSANNFTSEFVGGSTPAAPVPEPATLLLLGTGLIGIVSLNRKRIKKQRL